METGTAITSRGTRRGTPMSFLVSTAYLPSSKSATARVIQIEPYLAVRRKRERLGILQRLTKADCTFRGVVELRHKSLSRKLESVDARCET